MKRIIAYVCLIILVSFLLSHCSRDPEFFVFKGPYPGQKPPGADPEIFAPGFISFSESIEFAPTISPDGDEFYFSKFSLTDGKSDTYVTRRIDNIWTKPEKASINSHYQIRNHLLLSMEKRYFSAHQDLKMKMICFTMKISGMLKINQLVGQKPNAQRTMFLQQVKRTGQ